MPLMLKTGLTFAPGTTEDCKKLVSRLHTPVSLLGAYRQAREQFGSTDIVLAVSDQVPHIEYATRLEYCKHLKHLFGDKASAFKLWHVSAQSVLKLPQEGEAMWVVVQINGAEIPSMCVIHAIPYEETPVTLN
jgi:hypothetical protein